MVYGIKKFGHIQFQDPQRACVIMGQSESQILHSSYRRVNTLCFSGRPRIKNKHFIPGRLNNPVDGVMKEAISDRSFVDMATLRIVNKKREVAAVLVDSILEVFVQCKNMIFKIDLEFSHVVFIAFLFFELRPSVEQVLQRNYFIKHKYGK